MKLHQATWWSPSRDSRGNTWSNQYRFLSSKTLHTYPISACADQRSFSSMKRIKTSLCNTMTDKRLSSLAILHIQTLTKMLMITSLNLSIKRGGARTWFDGEMTVNLAFFYYPVYIGFFYRCLIVSCSFKCAILSQACDSSPCLNGGTCFEDESGKEYICKCSSGWRGNNCEKKTGNHYY